VPATFVSRSRVIHFGDVGVIHHCQGLSLSLEAHNHLPRVHAGLDDFQGHAPLDRSLLFGQEHHAHAAFADLFE
jgi:hypothetical protein